MQSTAAIHSHPTKPTNHSLTIAFELLGGIGDAFGHATEPLASTILTLEWGDRCLSESLLQAATHRLISLGRRLVSCENPSE